MRYLSPLFFLKKNFNYNNDKFHKPIIVKIMILKSLFRDHRRSESKILLRLKWFTMLVLMGCLVGYTAIVIIDVNQDAPIIKTSFTNADAIRVPGKYLIF